MKLSKYTNFENDRMEKIVYACEWIQILMHFLEWFTYLVSIRCLFFFVHFNRISNVNNDWWCCDGHISPRTRLKQKTDFVVADRLVLFDYF